MPLSRALWCGGQSACLAPCRPGFESGWGDHALPSLQCIWGQYLDLVDLHLGSVFGPGASASGLEYLDLVDLHLGSVFGPGCCCLGLLLLCEVTMGQQSPALAL